MLVRLKTFAGVLPGSVDEGRAGVHYLVAEEAVLAQICLVAKPKV